ncbi:hypothetical protein [Sphaerothrix gracilis]|uniref:hypothetical protein n=1 Tax=Sphaerothrix gracilis TaxID=3151835 RepID=UPI0031FCEFD8
MRPGTLLTGCEEPAEHVDDYPDGAEEQERPAKHVEPKLRHHRVQRGTGHTVEPSLDDHAPRNEQGEREHGAGVVEQRVVGATKDRSGVAHLQVDDCNAPRDDVDEDDGPSQQEYDSEDAAPDTVFLASEYAMVFHAGWD